MSGSKTVLFREINLPVSAGQSHGLKVARARLDFKKAFLVREVTAALEEVAGVSFTVSCLEAGRGTSGRENAICFQRKKMTFKSQGLFPQCDSGSLHAGPEKLLLQYIIAFLLGDHINEEFSTSLPFPRKMLSIGGRPHNKIGLSKGSLLSEIFVGANRFKSI